MARSQEPHVAPELLHHLASFNIFDYRLQVWAIAFEIIMSHRVTQWLGGLKEEENCNKPKMLV